MLLTTTLYVWARHWVSSSAPASPSSSRKKTSSCQRLFCFWDLVLAASSRAFRDWLRCKKPSPSRSDHPWDSFLLFLSMLHSSLPNLHPNWFWIDLFRFFYKAALVANMGERLVLVLDTELVLELTATVTHQALYHPSNRGYCYVAHAASLMVCSDSMDGYRTSAPKSLLCSITPM